MKNFKTAAGKPMRTTKKTNLMTIWSVLHHINRPAIDFDFEIMG
jgi:hypothetical protein